MLAVHDGDRITFRDDLDGLDDDETIVEDPELRRAKAFLFAVVMFLGVGFIVVLLVFFQPEGVVVSESWPNGYPRTRATYVSAPGEDGRVLHGAYRAWHENGRMAERGSYVQGAREGAWRFWRADGAPDEERSGTYLDGERVGD